MDCSMGHRILSVAPGATRRPRILHPIACSAYARAAPSTCWAAPAAPAAVVERPPRLLTSLIVKSRSLDQLVSICSTHQQQLSPVHISAALSACVKQVQHQRQQHQQQQRQGLAETAAARGPGWLAHGSGAAASGSTLPPAQLQVFVSWLLLQLQRQPEQCGARELAGVLWCLVKLGAAEQHLPAVAGMLARFADVAHTSSCQAVSMVLHSLASLGYQPSAEWLDRVLLQLVKSAWAAQQHRSYNSSGWSSAHRGTAGIQEREQQQPAQGAGASQPGSTQALANTLWAVARLQQPAVARTWLLPLLSLLCSSAGRGASGWSAAEQQQQQQQRDAIPFQGVANVVWACAVVLQPTTLAASPPGEPWAAPPQQQQQQQQRSATQQLLAAVQHKVCLLVEGCHAECLQSAKPGELTMLLWACSRLGVALSSRWWARLWPASQRLLPSCSATEAWVLLTALARLRVAPPGPWMAQLVAVTQPLLVDMSAGQASGLVWACGTLRMRPPLGWMAAAFQAVVQQAPQCSLVTISRLVWAASKLGYQPPAADMAALLAAVVRQLDESSPHQMSKVLLGCATLRLPARSCQAELLLAGFASQLESASPADVTMVLRALALWHPPAARSQLHSRRQQWWQQLECAPLQPGCRPALVAASGWPGPPALPAGAGGLVVERQLLGRLFHAAEGRVAAMSAAELCQCLCCAVRLGAGLSPEWGHALNHTLPPRVQQLLAGDLCLLLWSLARLGPVLQPRRQLHKEVLLQAQRLMLAGRFSRRDLTAFMWNYSQVFGGQAQAQLPRPWLSVFCHAACAQAPGFTGRQLGVLLKSLVLLRVVVETPLLEAAVLRMELLSANLSRGELADIAASLVQLQQRHLPGQQAAPASHNILPGRRIRQVAVQLMPL